MLQLNKIYCIDAREGLKKLSDESVDCVLTSPPYWSLRDYNVKPLIWDGDEKCKHKFVSYKANLAHENRQNLDGGTIGNAEFRKQLHGFGKAKAGLCIKCNAWKGALGLEPNYDLYIKHLCDIFDEIKWVLKKTGTLWVNLGDTYAGSWGNYAPNGIKGVQRKQTREGERWRRPAYADPTFQPPSSLKQHVGQKSLCLIPERFVLGMAERGWSLRNDIAWHKPNHMPSSVKDRFTCSWEHLFFFVKSRKYYFDLDAVRAPHKCLEKKQGKNSRVKAAKCRKNCWSPQYGEMRPCPKPGEPGVFHRKGKNPGDYWTIPSETRKLGAIIGEQGAVKVPGGAGWVGHPVGGEARIIREQDPRWLTPKGKNPGDCWEISTRPFKGAHFAVYPERLCEIPIKAGCPKEVCKKCGMPRLTRKVGGNSSAFNIRVRDVQERRIKYRDRRASRSEIAKYQEKEYTSKARQQTIFGCGCNAGFSSGVVLDPFIGAGTTAVVAKRLGRNFIGFEIKPEYVKIGRRRVKAFLLSKFRRNLNILRTSHAHSIH